MNPTCYKISDFVTKKSKADAGKNEHVLEQKFSNFLQEYKMQNIDDDWKPPPVIFEDINIFNQDSGPNYNADMDELEAQGYVKV